MDPSHRRALLVLISATLLLGTCVALTSLVEKRPSPPVPLPPYFATLTKLASRSKQAYQYDFSGNADLWNWTMTVPDYGESYALALYDLTEQWKSRVRRDGGKILQESALAKNTFLHKGAYHCAVDYHGGWRYLSISVAPAASDPSLTTINGYAEAK